MNTDSLETLLQASNVLRAHTRPALNRQTIGHHTFRVLILLDWVHYPFSMGYNLVRAALYHDVPEYHTGDIPGQIKASNQQLSDALDILEREFLTKHQMEIKDLSSIERYLLNICDRADLCYWSIEEVQMGNGNFVDIYARAKEMVLVEYRKYCEERSVRSPIANRVSLLVEDVCSRRSI